MTYRALTLGLFCLVALAFYAGPTRGQNASSQEGSGTLSTFGVGEVVAKPSSLIMVTSVSGQAELAADALKKFENNKEQAVKALKNLGIENLDVEETGMTMDLTYDQQQWNMMRRGGNVQDVKGEVIAREQLQIVVRGTDKMQRDKLLETMVALIDAVQDAGLTVGNANMLNPYSGYVPFSPIFAYRLDDPEALLAEARTKAVEDAKKRAESLAKETQVKLGPIISVSEQQMSASNNTVTYSTPYGTSAMSVKAIGGTGGHDMMLSDVMGEVPVRIRVNISYRIASP
ncbi:MAG: SIMPL domain-containing protein [Rhodospirillales bacterium]|nr:SIMPL domain-containing protein [Rhodospirillales bacterium]